MNHPDVDILESTTVHDGFLKVDVYRMRHRRFDGTWTPPLAREVCDRGHAVGILLYDPDRDAVVLIEQFRTGAAASGLNPWLTEVVAGMIDRDESAEAVARREAFEEAGCTVREIESICDYFSSPGAFTEYVSVFCGRVDSTGLAATGGLAEEHEDIRVKVVTADEAIRLLDENKLNNSVTVIALAWFARHRDRLRAVWTVA
ncbi:NUDIX domain-containing protein [Azospirillum halopraeferens]|uniref:NUDIX domain-containing protein n=1 Tax=Azospirillum halopraeferens TaxID=34010 RepID=UPI00042A43C7|nr:NUDIX domain-containing protein [Azospirillum halopraeferens]